MARLISEGTISAYGGIQIVKVKEASLDAGMSGAPVLDLEVGAVIGYVKASRGIGKPYGGYVVAASELQRLRIPCAAQSELHHKVNRTWYSAQAGDFDGPDPVAATKVIIEAVAHAADQREQSLPDGVDARALHQTVWIRRRPELDASTTRTTPRQRWRTERALAGLTVIAGDPGIGKSWLLAHHVSAAAKQAQDHLNAGGVLEDCTVPIRLNCATLVGGVGNDATLASLAKTLVSATVPQALVGGTDDRGLVSAIERALTDGRVLVCLDGLDEMPTGLRASLKLTLLSLLSRGNAVVIASRPTALTTVDEVAIDNRVDFELIGFTFRETVNFVRVWHKDHPEAADRLLSALTDRDELAQLAEVPLLLSFFCRLTDPFGRADYHPTNRTQLYRDVALHLLSGRWRGTRSPDDVEAMPDAVLRYDCSRKLRWYSRFVAGRSGGHRPV